ncbi:MAG: TIGR00375 family protein [Thermoplasmata archaeon]
MIINVDFHIHSMYSGATSKDMNIANIAYYAKRKGIDVMGSGDILNIHWLNDFKGIEKIEEGLFKYKEMYFVLTTEVEDIKRVHHVLIFSAMSKVEEFREQLLKKNNNLDTDGRPKLAMNGVELAELAKSTGTMIGPAHAFTPWTAMYAYYDSIKELYGEYTDYVQFLELGLSADTDYADRIEEIRHLTFLTNSDAHSYHPNKIAREFNRLKVESIAFNDIRDAIQRRNGRAIIMNVGIPPQEGKYNETACTRCFKHYTLAEAKSLKWRCPECKGIIKKGVKDRVEELATYTEPKHPDYRPPYLHLIPLSEIIAKSLNVAESSNKVQDLWNSLIDKYGNEIKIMVDEPLSSITTDLKVINAIQAFRNGQVKVKPGGGGQYGTVEIVIREQLTGQTKLIDF